VDATSVYWTDDSDRTVKSVPLTGGASTVVASAQDAVSGIAVDATSVYWTARYNVMKVSLAGGTPTSLASAAYGTAIAVNGTSVYWFNSGSGPVSSSVKKVALAGGTPTPLASALSVSSMAADANNVYWTNPNDGTVVKVASDGVTLTTLVSQQSGPSSIAVDATSVYWTNNTSGTVMKLTPK
jgi:sugar lactone lactonase YvrE